MRLQALTKRMGPVVATAAAAVLLGFTGTAQAAPAAPEPGMIVVEEVVPAGADAPVQTMGTSCTWPACGEAHNRTGKSLEIDRDSSSHWSCKVDSDHRKTLKDGGDSTDYWKDTDCVRSKTCKVYFRGETYDPGEWIRLYNPTWFYNLNC